MFRTVALRGAQTLSKLTGVAIHPNPRGHLVELYQKALRELNTLPDASFYKNAATAITKERLGLVESTPDIKEIVAKTQCLQIEQLILEANDELYLIANLKEAKPWESLQESIPQGQWD